MLAAVDGEPGSGPRSYYWDMNATSTTSPRPLRRVRDGKMIAGVVGGLAKYFDIDPTATRVAYVLVSILSAGFPGILVYIVLWVIVPKEA